MTDLSHKQRKRSSNIRIQIISASFGSLLSAFVVIPFEVVKNRLQAQQPGQKVYFKSSLDAAIKICKYEGVSKLWTGLDVSLVVAVPSAALYFSTYEAMKNWFQQTSLPVPLVPMFSGLSARTLTVLVTSPFDLIRTNMQAAADPLNRRIQKLGTAQVVKNTINQHGYRSLFIGLIPTLLRDVPFSAVYWTLYEESKRKLTERRIHKHSSNDQITKREDFIINFTSGAGSGMLASVLTQPIDVVKTRVQMVIDSKSSYQFRTTFVSIWKQEGLSGFFTGTLPRALKVAPACAVMISSYQLIKNSLL